MTPLRNIPAIRKLAEEQAREHHEALSAEINHRDLATQAPTLPEWGIMSPSWREYRINAAVALLCDLTRPASRDAVARLVAERVPGLQAWEVVAGCECGGGRLQMVLRCCNMPMLDRWEPDPAPVEALTLIALHVLTEPA